MAESAPVPEIPAELESFTLTLRMDATLTVGGTVDQWFKPGAEGSFTWRRSEWGGKIVDPLPTQDQLAAAYQYIQQGILSPVLEEVISASLARIEEYRKGKK